MTFLLFWDPIDQHAGLGGFGVGFISTAFLGTLLILFNAKYRSTHSNSSENIALKKLSINGHKLNGQNEEYCEKLYTDFLHYQEKQDSVSKHNPNSSISRYNEAHKKLTVIPLLGRRFLEGGKIKHLNEIRITLKKLGALLDEDLISCNTAAEKLDKIVSSFIDPPLESETAQQA